MTDERREFVEEMRAETRNEREMMAMAAILEGEAMDRYTQMFDCDDFEETAAGIIDRALDAEMDQEAGDWERVKGEASGFIDEAIEEYLTKEVS